ncbi:uncharacterized protein LTR77_005182 [Saxophila tyrrhenica]|uniref:non-specific serine/threonine protein kinase n=1 Tax=Saxophila tyrrhenica TaxID=1690608 RepID=A0AAV9PC18_9PEZI|nr:hypothetical protein LTR77_005182 [Saxophila tyrrhenica]
MPQYVYGKKARAVYDPFCVFGSPQRIPPGNLDQVRDLVITDAFENLKLDDRTTKKGPKGKRTVLGEKSPNSVALAVELPKQESKQKWRRRARKTVVEDTDDEEKVVSEVQDFGAKTQASTKVEKKQDKHDEMQEQQAAHDSNGFDDVPLFVLDHGYDTVEEDVDVVPSAISVVKSPSTRRDMPVSALDGSETPSITILPPTPPPADEYTEHCASLLTLSNHTLTDFASWSAQLSSHFDITKIAEASFGEVYRLSLQEQLPGFSSSDESVFKVIALKPPPATIPVEKRKRDAVKKKAEAMSDPEDVANEVRLLQRMSPIPGYTNFRDVRLVKGRPPAPFTKAFKAWNTAQKARKKDPSHFPDPSKKTSYSDDQLWAVIEMQDAGTDLENLVERGECSTIWQVWDIFWQVVLSLAKGEEGAQFEHRDLHLGNICVRQPPTAADGKATEEDIDPKRKLNFTPVETTIIDYTISRALMPDTSIAYQDLARDSAIFEGDSTEEYQYDIYRYMRGAVLSNDPYAETPFPQPPSGANAEERSWPQFHPVTNLIWLHYLLYKLLEAVEWPSATKAPSKRKKEAFVRWKRANDLEFVLLRVQELLDPSVVCGEEGLGSASEVVGLALREGWLGVEDVVGQGGDEGDGEEAEEEFGDGLARRLGELKLEEIEQAAIVVDAEEPEIKPRTRRKR